jgi:hypothetical protein
MLCESKIIVFDLDETLGYFTQLGIFWDAIKIYNNNLNLIINQSLFNKIFDLYPEFMRPNIINILKYLKTQKETSNCKKLLIYTNNQGPKEWAYYIKNYFEEKINYNLFDQLIGAFKVNGQKVEICRTTNSKNLKDLIKCTKINEDSKICFIDDSYYPDMINENIYYINLKPYIYNLPFDLLVNRFINSKIIDINNRDKDNMKYYLLDFMNNYNYIYIKKSNIEYNVDKALSKKLFKMLLVFFNNFSVSQEENIEFKLKSVRKTNKYKIKSINKTKKRR